MTKTSKTIVFFGNERLATGVTTTTPTFRSLIEHGYNIACVITNYPRIQTRNRRELEIIGLANQHNVPVLLPDKLSDIKTELMKMNANAGVLAAYGKIVPQSIIDVFPYGIINIHPSLLPHHRGPTPIESVILNGESKTGVSLMQLTNQLDAGPLFVQSEVTLHTHETKQMLANNLIQLGAAMISHNLGKILNGEMVASISQNDANATYDRLIEKNDGNIDWLKTAIQLEREVRAYYEWPKSLCLLSGRKLIITAAKVVDENSHQNYAIGTPIKLSNTAFGVQTAKGVLAIEKLKPEGKSEMTAQAFLAGYGRQLKLAS